LYTSWFILPFKQTSDKGEPGDSNSSVPITKHSESDTCSYEPLSHSDRPSPPKIFTPLTKSPYIHIYIYVCVCVCVCACPSGRAV
jgi:hypothetical protein